MFSVNRKMSRGLALLAFLAFVFAGEQAAVAGNKVPFHASYSLDLTADFSTAPLVGITSQGAVLATHLGLSTTRSVSETVNLVNGEGIAVHEFTAANGDTLLIRFHFLAIPTSPTLYDVKGSFEIAGGTGRFANATGGGAYQGLVQFTSEVNASGEFQLDGTISSVGSAK